MENYESRYQNDQVAVCRDWFTPYDFGVESFRHTCHAFILTDIGYVYRSKQPFAVNNLETENNVDAMKALGYYERALNVLGDNCEEMKDKKSSTKGADGSVITLPKFEDYKPACPAASYRAELFIQMGDKHNAMDAFQYACETCGGSGDSRDMESVMLTWEKKNELGWKNGNDENVMDSLDNKNLPICRVGVIGHAKASKAAAMAVSGTNDGAANTLMNAPGIEYVFAALAAMAVLNVMLLTYGIFSYVVKAKANAAEVKEAREVKTAQQSLDETSSYPIADSQRVLKKSMSGISNGSGNSQPVSVNKVDISTEEVEAAKDLEAGTNVSTVSGDKSGEGVSEVVSEATDAQN